MEWILTENSELPESSHVFWKKAKRRVMYKSRRKHLQPPRVWKGQVVRVLHGKSGGEMDGARNLVLLYIEGEEIRRVVLQAWESHTLSGCISVKVGGLKEQLGTTALIKDRVCCQVKRKVLHWGFNPMGGK